jgi:hypothetical protein
VPRCVALAGAVVLMMLGLAGPAVADPAPAPAPPGLTAPVNPTPPPSPPLPGIYGPGFSPDSGVSAPSGPVPGDKAPSSSDPGWLDIPGQIEKAIDEWFGKLVKLALDPVLHLLGATLLSSPNLADGRIAQVWDGVLITANTLYVLFVLVAGVTVMGHETVQSRYSLKQVLPRLLIGVVASNASLWAINQIVAVGNALSSALMDGKVAADGIGNMLTSLIVAKLFLPIGPMNLFFLLIGLVLAVLGAALLVGYLIRAAILVVLTAGAPLAFACHALPQTEGVAKLWWRAVFGCVAVQTLQALVLITAVQVFFDPQANTIMGLPNGGTFLDLLICLCLFVVLLKIPGWIKRIVLGRSPLQSGPMSGLARNLILYRGLGAVAPYMGAAMRHRLFPTPPRPIPPAPPTPGSGLAPRRPGSGGGGGGQGGWRPAPETVTATQSGADGTSGSGLGTPGNPRPHGPAPRTGMVGGPQRALTSGSPDAKRPARPHGPPDRTALPAAPTPLELPSGPFGRMLARSGHEPRGRQMGLFPRPAPTVRPEPLLPPPGPSAVGRSGVVHPALFSPTTLAPLPHATPPRPSPAKPRKKES